MAHVLLGFGAEPARGQLVCRGSDGREPPCAGRGRSCAARLAPRDSTVMEYASLVWLNCGSRNKAMQTARRVVALSPFNMVAWGYLGCALTWGGTDEERAEGLAILQRLLKVAPNHPSFPFWHYFLSFGYTEGENYRAAREHAQTAVDVHPGFRPAGSCWPMRPARSVTRRARASRLRTRNRPIHASRSQASAAICLPFRAKSATACTSRRTVSSRRGCSLHCRGQRSMISAIARFARRAVRALLGAVARIVEWLLRPVAFLIRHWWRFLRRRGWFGRVATVVATGVVALVAVLAVTVPWPGYLFQPPFRAVEYPLVNDLQWLRPDPANEKGGTIRTWTRLDPRGPAALLLSRAGLGPGDAGANALCVVHEPRVAVRSRPAGRTREHGALRVSDGHPPAGRSGLESGQSSGRLRALLRREGRRRVTRLHVQPLPHR